MVINRDKIAPPKKISPCRVCSEPSPLLATVDFNKNCEERGVGRFLPKTGILIGHHKCPRCGFLFTPAFDQWQHKEYLEDIYNDDYILVDPQYKQLRPAACTDLLSKMFGQHKESLSLLDYGGGNGQLADMLNKAGFRKALAYDPFTPEFDKLPDEKFNIVSCFETFEHVPDPHQLIGTIAKYVADNGLVIFSTLVQPANPEELKSYWWLVAPRNGHISLFTKKGLIDLWNQQGFSFASLNPNIHFAFRKIPEFASHIIKARNL